MFSHSFRLTVQYQYSNFSFIHTQYLISIIIYPYSKTEFKLVKIHIFTAFHIYPNIFYLCLSTFDLNQKSILTFVHTMCYKIEARISYWQTKKGRFYGLDLLHHRDSYPYAQRILSLIEIVNDGLR